MTERGLKNIQRFLFNVYKRFFLFLSRFLRFLTFFSGTFFNLCLERAGIRGGGGVLFTAHGIRATNSRHRLYTGLISRGMNRVQTLRSPQTSRDNNNMH